MKLKKQANVEELYGNDKSPRPRVPTGMLYLPYQLSLFWHWYLHTLMLHPLMTKAITAAVLSIVSELLGEYLTHRMNHSNVSFSYDHINVVSCLKQFIIGLLWRAPPVHLSESHMLG